MLRKITAAIVIFVTKFKEKRKSNEPQGAHATNAKTGESTVIKKIFK
jgi:hypothetical protein